jgi:hypothetical protein
MKTSEVSTVNNPLSQLFLDSVTSIVMMQRAKLVAENSEAESINNLANLSAGNGAYITTNDMPKEVGEKFVKDSANAHLSKIQSEQISGATNSMIEQNELEAKKKYIGKKIYVSRIDAGTDVFDAVLVDKNTGQYRVSKYNGQNVRGKIKDISLANNLIVIKPTLSARILTPNRLAINAYVVDPVELKLSVDIDL